jgi:hypothetical protein
MSSRFLWQDCECVWYAVLFAVLQFAALQKDFSKRWANQSRAVGNLFRGPNQIEDIAGASGLTRDDIDNLQTANCTAQHTACSWLIWHTLV